MRIVQRRTHLESHHHPTALERRPDPLSQALEGDDELVDRAWHPSSLHGSRESGTSKSDAIRHGDGDQCQPDRLLAGEAGGVTDAEHEMAVDSIRDASD